MDMLADLVLPQVVQAAAAAALMLPISVPELVLRAKAIPEELLMAEVILQAVVVAVQAVRAELGPAQPEEQAALDCNILLAVHLYIMLAAVEQTPP
jgi:hypothetical protein